MSNKIFDSSDIKTTGLTVQGVTVLSGNSDNNILTISGDTTQIVTVTDNVSATLYEVATTGGTPVFSVLTTGTRIWSFLYDCLNTTGTTGQVLTTNPTGITWSTISQKSRVTAQFNKTNDTALSDISGLTVNLISGKTYIFEANLYTTSNSSGGINFAVSGTTTATSIVYGVNVSNSNSPTVMVSTSLGGAVGGLTATIPSDTFTILHGTITVNTSGTLTVQFAQNTSNGTPSSVLVGSTLVVSEIA